MQIEGVNNSEATTPDGESAVARAASVWARGALSPPNNPTSGEIKARLIVADLAAALVGVMSAFVIQLFVNPVPRSIATDHLLVLAMSLPGFLLGARAYRLYHARANERLTDEGANILKTVTMGVASVVLIAFVFQFESLSRFWVALLVVTMSASLLIERAIARSVFAQMRADGKLLRRMVIVGTDQHARDLQRSIMTHPEMGYRVAGLVCADEHGVGGEGVLGARSDLFQILHDADAAGVIVSLGAMPPDELNALVRALTDAGYHVAISSSLLDIDPMRLQLQQIDGHSTIYVDRVIRDGWRSHAKRVYDVTLASIGLLISAPILLVSAIAIKLTSPGPVLFRQERVGLHGSIFEILKLRTMVVDAESRRLELADRNEADGPLFKMRDDPRVTRVGKTLRRLRIDELPQLFCVLQGTMSMVGPRPALPDEVAEWDDLTRERLRVPPGVTGMWQAYRDDETSFDLYRRLDLYYVENWSLPHDVRICARTVSVILNGRGAS